MKINSRKNLWKKILIVCLSFTVATSMFNFAAFADQPQNASNENTQTSQEAKDNNPEEWEKWDHSDYLPTGAGNYKLTCNVTLDSTWSVPGKNMKTAIDLNGYTISAQNKCTIIDVESTNLDIYDSVGTGKLIEGNGSQSNNKRSAGAIMINSGTTQTYDSVVNMYGGTITDCHSDFETGTDISQYGRAGAVLIFGKSKKSGHEGTFNMYDGKITGCSAFQGGAIQNEGIFNFYGGEISGNQSKRNGAVDNFQEMNMNYNPAYSSTVPCIINNTNIGSKGAAGLYCDNTASGTATTFVTNIGNAIISNNTNSATSTSDKADGAGIYIMDKAIVNISEGAQITNNKNTADLSAVGIGGAGITNLGTLNLNGGSASGEGIQITGNTSTNSIVAGVYTAGTLNVSGKVIIDENYGKQGTLTNASNLTLNTATGNKLVNIEGDMEGSKIGFVLTKTTPTSGNLTETTGRLTKDYSAQTGAELEDYFKLETNVQTYEQIWGGTSSSPGTSKTEVWVWTHSHIWNYVKKTGEDNKVYAYCSQNQTYCDHYGKASDLSHAAILTIDTPDMGYTGSPYNLTELNNEITEVTEAVPSDVYYTGTGSTTYDRSTTPPTAAGTYKAEVTIGGKTAYSTFTISKANATLANAPEGSEFDWSGNNINLLTNDNVGSATGGTIMYRLGETGEWSNAIPEAKDVNDNYKIYYFVKGDVNHNNLGSESEPIGFTVSKINPLTIVASADNVDVEYDGLPHSIDVNVSTPAEGATIYYKTEGGTYSEDAPQFTNPTGTPQTVYYKVVAEGYKDYESSATVKVSRKVITITPEEGVFKVYGDTDPTPFEYEHTPLVGGDTISGELSRTSGESVGEYDYDVSTLIVDNDKYVLQLDPDADQFEIVAKELADCTVELTPILYTFEPNTERTPTLIVKDGEKILVEGTDYEVSGTRSATNVPTESDHYTITVTGKGEYAGTVDKTWTIAPKEITNEMLAFDHYTYDYEEGTTHTPVVTVQDGDYTLVKGTDYTILSSSTESAENIGTYTIGVDGKGNYTSSTSKNWIITAPISAVVTGFDTIYDGNQHIVTITGDIPTGAVTKYKVDGEYVEGTPQFVDSEDHQVTVEITCDGYIPFSQTVNANIKKATVTITPVGEEKFYGEENPEEYLYTETSDTTAEYTLSGGIDRESGEDASTDGYAYTIGDLTINDPDNFNLVLATGADVPKFVINKAPVVVTPDPDQGKVYKATEPTLTYTDECEYSDEYEFVSGTNIAREGTTDSNVGEYAFNIGTLALTEESSKNFELVFDDENVFTITPKQVTAIEITPDKFDYEEGVTKTPSIVVKSGDDVLTEGTDFDFSSASVKSAIMPNTYTVTANGKGNYYGSVSDDWMIRGKMSIIVEGFEKSYDGQATGVSISGAPYGSTITYKVDGGAPTTTPPTFTDVCEHQVTVIVTHPDFISSEQTVTAKIKKATITVTPKADSKYYGQNDPSEFEYDAVSNTGAPFDTLEGAMTREEGENANTYAYQKGSLALSDDDANNFNLVFKSGEGVPKFTIMKSIVVVTPDPDQGKVYKAAEPTLTYTAECEYSDEYEFASGTNIAREGTVDSNVGEYAFNVGTLALTEASAKNFELEFNNENVFTITPRQITSITITPDVYDYESGVEHKPAIEVKYNGETLTKGTDYNFTADSVTAAINPDIYTVTAIGTGNYTGEVAANWKIRGTMNPTVEGFSKAYDGNTSIVTVSGVPAGSTITYKVDGGEETTEPPQFVDKGEHQVTVKITNPDFGDFEKTVPANISPAVIKILPIAASKIYKEEDPAFVYEAITETTAPYILTGAIDRNDKSNENVGTYTYNLGTLAVDGDTKGNFSLQLLEGETAVFKINPKPITQEMLTIDPDEFDYEQGTTRKPAVSVIDGETLVKDRDYKIAEGSDLSAENPGTYTIGVTGTGNYTNTVYDEWIIKSPMNIKVNGYERVYDGESHAITITDIPEGATVTYTVDGTPYTGGIPEFTNVGTHEIKVHAEKSGMTPFDATVYAKIDKATIVITPVEKWKIYGEENPTVYEFDATCETTSEFDVTGEMGRAPGEDVVVGGYAYDISNLKPADENNFKIEMCANPPVFSIYPKPITLDMFNFKDDIYQFDYTGEDVTPEFTVMDGEKTLQKGTDYVIHSTSTTTAKDSGKYTIEIEGKGNYWQTQSRNWNIKEVMNVTAQDINKIYDGTDSIIKLTGVPEGAEVKYTVDGTEVAGVPEFKDAGTHNVEISITKDGYMPFGTTAKVNISKATITIKPDAASKIYGNDDPEHFTYTDTADTTAEYTLTGWPGRQAGENVDSYAFNIGDVSVNDPDNFNINLAVDSPKFEVKKATVTVTPNPDQGKVYGEAEPTLTYSHTSDSKAEYSFVPNTNIIRETGENVVADGYKFYQGTLALTDTNNFDLKFNDENVFTITPKPITQDMIKFDSNWFNYDGSSHGPEVTIKDGKLEYTLEEGKDFNYTSDSVKSAVEPGTYQVEVQGMGNYTDTANKDWKINAPMNVVVTGFDTIYDAKSHKVGVTGEPHGATVLYSLDGGAATIFPPLLTEVGEHNVTVNVTCDGYVPFTTNVTTKISPATITVTPESATKVYGEEDPLPFSYQASCNTEAPFKLTGALEREEGQTVGDYQYTVGNLAPTDNTNFKLVLASGENKFSITKATVYVAPDSGQGKVYKEDDPTLTYTSYCPTAEPCKITGALGRESGQSVREGGYKFNLGTLALADKDNYQLEFVDVNEFTINPKPITDSMFELTPNQFDYKKGTVNKPTIKVTDDDGEVLDLSEEFVVVEGSITSSESPGTFNVAVKGIGNYTNQVDKDWVVRAPMGAIVTGFDTVYDANEHIVTVAGYPVGSTITYTVDGGEPTTTPPTFVDAGSHDVKVNIECEGYIPFEKTVKATIQQATITIMPNAASKIYGEQDTKPYTYTSSANTTVAYKLTGEMGRTAGENVVPNGYAFTKGSLAPTDTTNFKVVMATGTDVPVYMINKATVVVTPKPDQSKIYGEKEPVLQYDSSCATSAGYKFVEGTLLGRTSGEDVIASGYKYNLGTLKLQDETNYKLEFNDQNVFMINPKQVIVTPKAMSKTYGDTDPTFEFTLSEEVPLVKGTNIDRQKGEDVVQGGYQYNLGNLQVSNDNYYLTLEPKSPVFTINPKSLKDEMLTLNPRTVDYTGNAITTMPMVNDTIQGNQMVLKAGKDYTLNPDQLTKTNAGTYEVTVTGTGNYKDTATQKWTINKVNPIYELPTPKDLTYNGEPQILLEEGWVTNGDYQYKLVDGGDWQDTIPEATNPGNYQIQVMVKGDENHYDLGSKEEPLATLYVTIKSPPIEAKADDVNVVYDGKTHKIDVQVEPLVSEHKVLYSLDGESYTDENPQFTNVSTNKVYYVVSAYGYTDYYGEANVTITKAPVTIIPDKDQSKIYGEKDPEHFTYTSTGLIGKDTITGELGRASGEDVGQYDYTLGTLDAGDNYELSMIQPSEQFAINPKELTKDMITIDPEKTPWTGDYITPKIIVKDGENILTLYKDYTIEKESVVSAKEPGTYKIIFVGIGNYTGQVLGEWTITPKDTPTPTPTPTPIPPINTNTPSGNNTGDTADIALFGGIGLAAGVGAIVIRRRAKKDR